MASSSSSTAAAAAAASNMYYNHNNHNNNNNLNAAYRGGSGYHHQYATAAAPPAVAGPRAKCDQVVFEAITKATEMIIEARCPQRNQQPPQQQQQQQQYSATTKPTTPPSSVSARFNLQVPERPEIRQSLQIHRKSLHLPLRLEIYYNRQLLERWCLEYSPQLHSSNNNNNTNTRHHHHRRAGEDNSIVQLRRVCKKIVVWLRSLYCWIRLLPCHSLMVQQQQQLPYSPNNAGGIVLDYALEICEASPVAQFRYQTLPPVPTDYGSLQWHVWYNPTEPSSILVSHKNHGASHASSSSFANSRPIPIATKPLLSPNLTTPTMTNHAGTATTTTTTTATATNTSRSAPVHHDDVGIRDMYFQHQQLQQQHQKQYSQSYRHLQAPPLTTAASPAPPPATLSSSPKHHRPCSIDGTRGDYTLSHRAALHDPPPTLDSAYGYAYNNAPMTTTTMTTTAAQAQSPHSPRLLPGTPPASLTPPLAPLASTPPAFGLGAPLIPPRNNNTTTATGLLAPPFAGLPTKLEDVPRTTNTAPFTTSAMTSTTKLQQQQQQQQQHQPPMTSLDLLHSSPFKGGLSSLVDSEFRMSVYYQQQGSADDDYTVDVPAQDGGGAVDIDDTEHNNNNNNMDDNAVLDGDNDDDDDDDDDMPFAVDAVVPTDLSLAHKCSASGTKHKKLQLFGSQSSELNSLTQQLHDFKAFGASLHQ